MAPNWNQSLFVMRDANGPRARPGLRRKAALRSGFMAAIAVAMAGVWPAYASEPEVTGDVRISGDATPAGGSRGSATFRITKPSGRAVVTMDFKKSALDLSAFRDIALPIKNGTASELDVMVNATSDLEMEWLRGTSGRFLVRAWEADELTVLMARPSLSPDHPHVKRLGNLFAFPWGHQQHWRHLDASAILQVTLRISWSGASAGQTAEIGPVRGSGSYSTDPAELDRLEMPLVDPFGQLRAGEWPGKVKAARDLAEDSKRDLELVSAVTMPGEGRSRFGGMTGGPKLKATGYFRVEKIGGKWWFVDPEGNLFWSLGVNCVGSPIQTKVEGREELFSEEDQGKRTASHYWDNVKRKFGEENWQSHHTDLTLARMFDWGLNTVGAWSIGEISETGKVPYTLIIHADQQRLGRITKMSDPFSDGFKNSLDRILPELAAKHAKSPWLIGVFIDNELDWQGGHELVKEIIRSYPGAPARVALVEFLRGRHGDVAGLNRAWDTSFKSLEEIQPAHGPLGKKAFKNDLDDFQGVFADRYFQLCREAMRKYFPNHLYLGCRFHQLHPIITAAASRHCDVISLNLYQHGLEDVRMKTDEDRPWLISEFHFGVADHGVWGVGLTWAADADNQADLYEAYVSDALRNPNFVGAHWFAWTSQSVAGRSDGENFGMGLVTIVDRPLERLIRAVKEVSKDMYDYRLGEPRTRIGGATAAPPPGATGKAP